MSIERAKAWAAAGWPVFPTRDGKPLAGWDWRVRNTTDPAVVDDWWSEDGLGVACVPGLAGCWVLDVDVKNGKDGEASLRALEEKHGFETWEAPRQRTRSGGLHMFFRGAAPTSTGRLAPGLDTRGGSGEGGLGFIFCHSERPPTAPGLCPVGPGPLVALVGQERQRAAQTVDEPGGGWDAPENVRRATKYLASISGEPEGGRNAALFLHACKARDLGVSEGKLLELLEEHPAALGDPALDEDEAALTIDSAYRNGQLSAGNAASSGNLDKLAAEVWAQKPTGRQKLALWSERRDRPVPPWLWHDLLPAGGLVGMYGQGGSFKTFLALRLGVAIANGSADLGGRILRSGPVVYVAGEGQQEPRLRALEAEFGPISDNFALFDGLDLTSPEDQAVLRDDIGVAITETWGGRAPVLLVVDTLNRAAPGMDENSARDMSSIVATCDAIRRALGCAVLLVHHTPKGSDDWRGSTAVWNALDAALLVKRERGLRARMYARRVKDAADGAAWDIGLKEQGRSIVVASLTERTEAKGADGEAGQPSKAAQQQRMREVALDETRAKVAREILDATGSTMAARSLARQMCASLDGADPETVRSWLRAAVRKGGALNELHPLASCVATLAPLAFTASA